MVTCVNMGGICGGGHHHVHHVSIHGNVCTPCEYPWWCVCGSDIIVWGVVSIYVYLHAIIYT